MRASTQRSKPHTFGFTHKPASAFASRPSPRTARAWCLFLMGCSTSGKQYWLAMELKAGPKPAANMPHLTFPVRTERETGNVHYM